MGAGVLPEDWDEMTEPEKRSAYLYLFRVADAGLTDFVYAHGSDFDEAAWPGMASLRAVLILAER